MSLIKLFRSFGYGARGWLHVIRREQNMRIHLFAAILVVGAGIFFRISNVEWLAVVLCIGAVLTAECLNTSIERLADRVTDKQDPLIGQSKDAAAAAVCIVALMSLVVAAIVFVPKLLSWIQGAE